MVSPEARIWTALEAVRDPELPVVSVVDLGIVRTVDVQNQQATVKITPTFSGCPALETMRADIEATLTKLGFGDVRVETVLSPPWSSDFISEVGRAKLHAYGVAPPGPASEGIMLEPPPVPCPRCGSLDTVMRNPFGPTLCKSVHTCNSCLEPFEAFKAF